jgi:hypothetical protein
MSTTVLNEQAVKLMNRIDFIEIDEAKKEVFVRDDMGVYILHDCCLQDMAGLE